MEELRFHKTPLAERMRPATLDDLLGQAAKGPPLKMVVGTVDRSDLVEVQTPQVFELDLLRKAYAQIEEGKVSGQGVTDDAGLVEALGTAVVVVESESTNLKITRPEDLELARAWIQMRQQTAAAKAAKRKLLLEEDE